MSDKITISLKDIKNELEDIENYVNSLYNPLSKSLCRIELIPKSQFHKYYKQIHIVKRELEDLSNRLYQIKSYILENFDIHDDNVSSILTNVRILHNLIKVYYSNLDFYVSRLKHIEETTTIEDFLFVPGEIP